MVGSQQIPDMGFNELHVAEMLKDLPYSCGGDSEVVIYDAQARTQHKHVVNSSKYTRAVCSKWVLDMF